MTTWSLLIRVLSIMNYKQKQSIMGVKPDHRIAPTTPFAVEFIHKNN